MYLFFSPWVPVGICCFSAGSDFSTFPLEIQFVVILSSAPHTQLSPVVRLSLRTFHFVCFPLCTPPSSRRSWGLPSSTSPSFASLTAHCTSPPGSYVHLQLLLDYPVLDSSPWWFVSMIIQLLIVHVYSSLLRASPCEMSSESALPAVIPKVPPELM